MGQSVPGVSWGAWFVAILFLLALALAAYYLVRIVRQGQGRVGASAGMRVVGRLPLAMNQSLVLVSVGGQLLLLGVGQRIELLERIEDPSLISELTQIEKTQQAAPIGLGRLGEADFRSLLEESLRRVRDGRRLLRRGRDDGDA
ncbi:MAG: flagellar biosynthetic protein FliO [Thermaerobacter sp.]|nr:flagellar biosynthetic protein FliO [Thermaerobacter sp.]